MKKINIFVLSTLAITLMGCVGPNAGVSVPEVIIPAKTLIGTWEQNCERAQDDHLIFEASNITMTTGDKVQKGTWTIDENEKLVIDFDGQTSTIWNIEHIEQFHYRITHDSKVCHGWKLA